MKLQEICDRIKSRHDFPHVLSDDFIIKTMFESLPEIILNDECLGGLELAPFDEMIMWPEPFPTDFGEPSIIMPEEHQLFGWPATIADVISK